MDQRTRTLHSLDGLSVGDAFGERFFFHGAREPLPVIEARALPPPPWRWTDDTHMALSVVEVLAEHGHIEQDALARAFSARFAEEPRRGYAHGAFDLLTGYGRGTDWRREAPALFDGGSWGNGGAMRAAPIGAYFAGDPVAAARAGARSAEVTHAHPEGQAGAVAVAVAAALLAGQHAPEGGAFIDAVMAHVPEGLVFEGLRWAAEIPAHDFDRAVDVLGTGWRVSALDTVPFCLWVVAHERAFEPALWRTVAGLGDRDTTCAIVGGILAAGGAAIPEAWLAAREPLPAVWPQSR